MKYGNLTESSGPLQACNVTDFPSIYFTLFSAKFLSLSQQLSEHQMGCWFGSAVLISWCCPCTGFSERPFVCQPLKIGSHLNYLFQLIECFIRLAPPSTVMYTATEGTGTSPGERSWFSATRTDLLEINSCNDTEFIMLLTSVTILFCAI